MTALTYPSVDRPELIAARVNTEDVSVSRFSGTEALSQLFQFTIEFSSPTVYSAATLIAAPVAVGLKVRPTNANEYVERIFHGLVSRFAYRGSTVSPDGSGSLIHSYRAELVPWMWQLTRSTNCRIFQNKTVPEIVAAVFDGYSAIVSRGTDSLTGSYPAREYCVQYRESDFAFVSRLLEEEGIFYRFDHSLQGHSLVLADNTNGYFNSAMFNPEFGEAGTTSNRFTLTEWQHEYDFTSGTLRHADASYFSPPETYSDDVASNLGAPQSNLAVPRTLYDYAAGLHSATEADRLILLRAQEQEARHEVITGAGIAVQFAPGARFEPQGTPSPPGALTSYAVVSITHTYAGTAVQLRPDEATGYRNTFRCQPSLRVFRPERTTTRPFVRGTQTATVTGPDGELVYTDSLGRVKIRFHWDQRTSPSASTADTVNEEDRTCWVRVSQAWAGAGWGSSLLPHIGHEVLVSFLEGDPDRPVVTGRVYNNDNATPEDLPDNKLRAVIAEDHTGNFIVFDADEGVVETQNSAATFNRTIGDVVEVSASAGVTVSLGISADFSVGASISAALAASVDASAGYSSSFSFGGAYGCSFGMSFDWAKGNFVNAGDSVGQVAFKKDAAFVSHNSVTVAAGSGVNNGVLLVSSDHVTLSYGMTDPRFAGDPSLGLWAGVVGGGALATVGVGLLATAAYLGASASEASDQDEMKSYRDGSIAAGTLGGVTATAAAILLWLYAKKWSQINQPVHGGALPEKSKIRLGSEGVIISGASKVNLFAGLYQNSSSGSVNVYASDFKVASKAATFKGDVTITGKLNSMNIVDIGQPAAAAAAMSETIAELSAMTAQLSAEAAQDAARKALQAVAALANPNI